MNLWTDVVSGVVIAISTTAILTLFAILWRRWVIQKYKLSQESKQVLASLWDEGLIRIPSEIAKELGLEETRVKDVLNELEKKGLIRIRTTKNGEFWKITLKGKEYLSQLSWLGDII